MGTEDDKQDAVDILLTGKTKGKRSKLSQRRPSFIKDSGAGAEGGLLINNEGNNGVAEDAGVQQQNSGGGNAHNHQSSNNIFNEAGSDPMGMDSSGGMNLDASPDGGLMLQGSPTLLSALKGSSLHASAFGQDFSTSFKDDDMSILGDFKNAAARFSMNPLDVAGNDDDGMTAADGLTGEDGLAGEGELGSDSLWSSFPVDVDSLLPSRTPVPSYGDLAGGIGGVRYDMGGMGGGDEGQGQGAAGPSCANAASGGNDAGGGNRRIGGAGGGGDDGGEMFRSSSSQYFYQQYGGDANGDNGGPGGLGNGNGNNGGGQPAMSNGGSMSYDSSYGGAYGMQQQLQQNAGAVAMQMGIRGAGGAGPGPGHMQHMQQIQMQPNGQMAFNAQQQQQQGMMPQQMRPYFVPGAQGQQMAYVQMSYQQQPMMQGGMMIQQPYQYTQMVQPGQQQQQQAVQGVGGKGADGGGGAGKGGKRAGAGKQKAEDKRKASKGNEHNGMQQQPVDMGGAMMAGQMVPVGPYGMQPMQAIHVQQMRASGTQGNVVYQQHPQHMGGPGMMMQQPGPRMYSASSSVSTNGSGNAMVGPGGPMGGVGHMMVPPYIINQMPMGVGGAGGNGVVNVGPNGQMQPGAGGAPGGMGVDEAGLAELETIVAKLDKPTMSNIKESLYRLARSARNRGVRSGDGGAQGQPPPQADKAKSLVDKCVANLLYHRYTDMPSSHGRDVQQHGQQQLMMNNNNVINNNGGGMIQPGGPIPSERNEVAMEQRALELRQRGMEQQQPHGAGQGRSAMARPNSMANVNGIQGRHGSA